MKNEHSVQFTVKMPLTIKVLMGDRVWLPKLKTLLAVLLCAFVLEHAPFRLATFVTETSLMQIEPQRLTNRNDRYWDAQALEFRLQRLGWNVEYRAGLIAMGDYGTMHPRGRKIFIEETLSWNDRYSILAHEAGHTLQPPRLTETQGEVFAEAVGALVARDGLREHARYAASVKSDLFTAIAYWREIYAAVAVLEAR